MLPSFTIFFSLATLLSPALCVPSPKGGRGGSSGSSGSGLGLGLLAGTLIADPNHPYRYNAPAPDTGFGESFSCDYNGAAATDVFATDPAWISSMSGCLNVMDANNWDGALCQPPTGGVEFGFWKGEDDYSDPVDCFQRCQGCLSAAINASQAITTKCQYEYKTHRLLGYKTHTCTMGYDKH